MNVRCQRHSGSSTPNRLLIDFCGHEQKHLLLKKGGGVWEGGFTSLLWLTATAVCVCVSCTCMCVCSEDSSFPLVQLWLCGAAPLKPPPVCFFTLCPFIPQDPTHLTGSEVLSHIKDSWGDPASFQEVEGESPTPRHHPHLYLRYPCSPLLLRHFFFSFPL